MKKILYLFILSILISCTTYKVGISSLCDSNYSMMKKYIMSPWNEHIDDKDLQYIEFANYVEQALLFNGYIKSNEKEAEIVVFLQYGISEPFTVQKIEKTNTYTNKSGYKVGNVYYPPKREVTGTESKLVNVINYESYIQLTGINLKQGKENSIVWETFIHTFSESNDLRTTFPIMVKASKSFIGKDTNYQIDKTFIDFNLGF
jgi:hypothetical protein